MGGVCSFSSFDTVLCAAHLALLQPSAGSQWQGKGRVKAASANSRAWLSWVRAPLSIFIPVWFRVHIDYCLEQPSETGVSRKGVSSTCEEEHSSQVRCTMFAHLGVCVQVCVWGGCCSHSQGGERTRWALPQGYEGCTSFPLLALLFTQKSRLLFQFLD